MVPSNLVQQLEASIQLRQGANPLISLALSSHPYKTINRLVIKKVRHPASPRCKTNIRSNTVLDVSPPVPRCPHKQLIHGHYKTQRMLLITEHV